MKDQTIIIINKKCNEKERENYIIINIDIMVYNIMKIYFILFFFYFFKKRKESMNSVLQENNRFCLVMQGGGEKNKTQRLQYESDFVQSIYYDSVLPQFQGQIYICFGLFLFGSSRRSFGCLQVAALWSLNDFRPRMFDSKGQERE